MTTTRAALLAYLSADTEPRPMVKIYQFMRFWGDVQPGAVRMALYRLCRAGVIVRTDDGRYTCRTG